jgi:hypothetical protein
VAICVDARLGKVMEAVLLSLLLHQRRRWRAPQRGALLVARMTIPLDMVVFLFFVKGDVVLITVLSYTVAIYS